MPDIREGKVVQGMGRGMFGLQNLSSLEDSKGIKQR